jgi:hypothetical protein
MSKKEMLQNCLNDYERMLKNGDCRVVVFERHDGNKSGVGNKEIIQKLLMLLVSEAKQQLAEL